SDPPPEVHIVSPVRGSDFFKDERLDQYSALRFKVGDTIRFAAVAKDRKDGWLADPAFRWSINWGERGPVQCAARGTGSQMDFTVPPADVGWYWVEVSAKDSSGVTGEDYITFKVER
ncbi:MAG: hypothetical protein ACREFX_13170, partial [Opitutaceae bacterium]